MNRSDAIRAIETWDPTGPDLADDVVRWLDEDAGVRAAFDARFTPAPPLADAIAPPDVRGRVLAQVRPRRFGVVSALLPLAAVLLGTVIAGAAGLTSLAPRPMQAGVGPQPQGQVAAAPERVKPPHSSPEQPLLEELGYVEAAPPPRARRRSGGSSARRSIGQTGPGRPHGGAAPPTAGGDAQAAGSSVSTPRFRRSEHAARPPARVSRPSSPRPAPPAAPDRIQVTQSALAVREFVRFEIGSSAIDARSGPLLDEVARILADVPEIAAIEVSGHTSDQGSSPFNKILSDDRAEAVRQALIERGVAPDRVVARGYGETRPLTSNATAEGMVRNSRVEFDILAQKPAEEPAAEPEAGGESYTDYGHHAFVRTGDDPLSTFSVDADTASYALVRRKLTQGHLPPAAAVRVEEFVNAFPYDDPPPSTDPFAVRFEGSPNPFNPRTHLVRIGVQGRKVPADARQPLHLTLLIDTSGSMRAPDKLGLVQESLRMLTEELRDGDSVAIVAYAGRAGLVLEPTPISRRSDILDAIERLTAGGSTAMGRGLDLAYDLALRAAGEGGVSRVVIASDGDANVGATDHAALTAIIRERASQGVALTTLGFGEGNYRDTIMEQLANDGDGNYFYIDSLDEARKVLVDRLTGTLVVIARDVKLQVEWTDQVEAWRLIGYENRDIADHDFRNDRVDAGEVGSGHHVTALYEVALRPDASGQLATLRVRHKAPGRDAPAAERRWTLDADALRPHFGETSRDFRIAVAAATFAEVLRGSPHAHGAGYGAVLEIAQGARRPEYPEDAELIRLVQRAAAIDPR